MTPEQELLAAAFLAELWPVCREVPREQREVDRALAVERSWRDRLQERAS